MVETKSARRRANRPESWRLDARLCLVMLLVGVLGTKLKLHRLRHGLSPLPGTVRDHFQTALPAEA